MVDMIKVLAAKKEAIYGTDSAPTLAANAILTRNFRSKPVETDRIDRNLDGRSYGATPGAPSNERQTISYEVELAGSGAAGTAAPWMELLEACGLAAPVLTATVKAEQKPGTPGVTPGALTQYHWIGDQQRKMVGSRGSFSIDITAGSYPFAALNFIGMIPAASPFGTSAPGASTLTRWKDPVEANSQNTAILLDGFACGVRSFSLDMGVQNGLRSLIGAKYVNRGNHSISGRMVVEAPGAAKDYIASLRSGGLVPLSIIHGTAAGNIVEITAPRLQITDCNESDEDGKLMWELAYSSTIQAGQDDLTIISR